MRRAALAWLVGWYALIPPLAGGQADQLAPMARWEQLRAFDTAEACEQMLMGYAKRLNEQGDTFYGHVQYARCVSATDPRLSERGSP